MSKEEAAAGEAGGRDALTEQAGETTSADMVSGPVNTRPVGADTMVKVGDASDSVEKGGGE